MEIHWRTILVWTAGGQSCDPSPMLLDTQNLAGNSPCLQPQCLKSLPVLRCTSKPHGRLNGWGSVGVLVLFEARLAGWASFSAVLERPVVKEIPTCQLWRNFRIKDVPKKILVPPKKVFRLNVFQIVVTFGLCHVSQILLQRENRLCLSAWWSDITAETNTSAYSIIPTIYIQHHFISLTHYL